MLLNWFCALLPFTHYYLNVHRSVKQLKYEKFYYKTINFTMQWGIKVKTESILYGFRNSVILLLARAKYTQIDAIKVCH